MKRDRSFLLSKWSIGFLLVTLWSSDAWSFGCESLAVVTTTKDDGTEIGIYVPREQISRTPEWLPGSGDPPLAITRAVEIAMEWAKAEYARYDSVEIREISLQEYGCSLTKARWLYILDLKPVIDGNTLWGPGNWVAVLMDGTVIGPTEKP